MSDPSSHWRQLIEERVAEAVTRLGGAHGVHGLVVAGSVARGEPWPMSDIDLAIVAARIATWRRQAVEALAEAHETRSTSALRVSARALRMVLLEQWGERLGSMGREWTRFERMAARHGEAQLAARVAVLAGADVPTAAERATIAPLWLRERVELCRAARVAVGEQVSPAENARDQVAAYTLHVVRKRPDLDGPWTGTPDPHFDAYLAELSDLLR